MPDVQGPPIVPAGIFDALSAFEQHLQQGPPIIPGNPVAVIPGNPVFPDGTGVQIVGALFGLHDAHLG